MTLFTSLDLVIVVTYMVSTVALASWLAKGQRSLEDYFVAGRSAPWWAVGVSIVATDLSAISYLGSPAYAFQNDLQLGIGYLLFPFIMLLVVYLFVPFLARLRLFTIYEYLEQRFSLSVRTFASGLFLLLRGGWLANAIYTQSLVLSVIFPQMSLVTGVWLLGGMTTLYTMIGGMRAVLWTDVMQFFVLVGGIVAVAVAILLPFDFNISQIWNIAAQGGHTRLVSYQFDVHADVTVWALILGMVVINLSSYGSDQLIVQRYLTTSSRRDMARAVLFNGVLVVPVMLALSFLGVGFAAYYQTHPELNATLSNPEWVFPHFMTHALRPGLTGLVLAGLFAASMSSLSAGFNSVSTATLIDFYWRFERKAPASEALKVRMAKWCTLCWGVVSCLAALYVEQLGGIVEISLKINGLFSGPLLGMFLLGLLTNRANSFGALLGALIGAGATLWVSSMSVSLLLYGPVGCMVTLTVGYCLSILRPSRSSERAIPLTVWHKGSQRAD